jgi:hypothetical protein
MKINKKTLFKFDVCLFFGLSITITITILSIIGYIIEKNINWRHTIIYSITINMILLFILYNFFKSICGGIFILKTIINKEYILNKNVIYLLSNIIFLLVNIYIIFIYGFSNYKPELRYTAIIWGLLFEEYQLYIISTIIVLVNMIGTPMWIIYIFSNNKINNIIKIIFIILTKLMVLFINSCIIGMVTTD